MGADLVNAQKNGVTPASPNKTEQLTMSAIVYDEQAIQCVLNLI